MSFFLDPEYLALKGMREVGRCNDPKRKQKERVVFVLCLIPVVVVVLLISFLKLVNNTSCVDPFQDSATELPAL